MVGEYDFTKKELQIMALSYARSNLKHDPKAMEKMIKEIKQWDKKTLYLELNNWGLLGKRKSSY